MIIKYKPYLIVVFVLCYLPQLLAQSKNRPNILFAISDDQSYYHTSKAGCEFVKTPAFDRIANEGMFFTNCYASSPGCAPSRSALVTGRHHWQNEQAGQHASAWLKKYVPFVDELEQHGYATGRTGKGVRPYKYAANAADTLWRYGDAAGKTYSNIKFNEANDSRYAKGISREDYFSNFKYFMDSVKGDKPFFFWYGSHEPHRGFEKGSWKNMGKSLQDVEVPAFLPDNEVIRGDILDYAVEIEWFDYQLQQMLEYLESIGELDNTMVIVTSDNGMAFPRAKANCYEYGVHVPLAVRYPKEIKQNKTNKTPISFIDLAPTFLDLANVRPEIMMPLSGKSILDIWQGNIEDTSRAVFSGRERHSSSRYENWGYPQRSVRKGDYLFIWNMKPDRWPAGAPQRYDEKNPELLLPIYSLDSEGKYKLGTIFADIDDCPSKTYLIEHYNDEGMLAFLNYSTEKRPEFELYNVTNDRDCLVNLAGTNRYKSIEKELNRLLIDELKRTNDPRVVGPNFEVFDSYLRYSAIRNFPKP